VFGYVRPCQPELKCRDFDRYKAAYCGLCQCLRQRYGLLAPMFLSYDLTFLALLLWQEGEPFQPCSGRCHVKPWARRAMCPAGPTLQLAADESVILTWWKLRDGVADGKGWKKLGPWTLSVLLRPAYRKAAGLRPEFDRRVRSHLERLARLEREQCPSMDRPADAFACLLRDAVPEEDRINREILYHTGRWIYLADARDDLEQDRRDGAYNPLVLRYGPQVDDEALGDTMTHSLELAQAAFQLGDFGERTPILENILYLGLPLVQRAVFDGSWSRIKKQKIWRNDT